MGKANQGVFGAFQGKVGNVVGRIRQGQQVYCIYQPQVANPQTAAQQSNRLKLRLLSQLGSAILSAIMVGFKFLDGYAKGSAFSSFIGYNAKNTEPFSGSYPNMEIDFQKVAVSEGSLAVPFNMQGSLDSNTLSLTWADNSGIDNALATDKVCAVVYNKTKNSSVFNSNVATRSTRTGSVTVPTGWNGDSVEAYAFMSRAEETLMSKTIYLGSFTV